jgi:glycosyltransferase involved in cell wall biosynthesis
MFTNTYVPHVGGVARSVATITQDLRKAGHEVLVIAPRFPGDDQLDDQGVVRVPAIQNFNASDFSVRLALPFVFMKQIEEFGPHVVHSHHPFLLGDAALRVARRRRVPLVFTHHTLYERYTHYVPLDSEALEHFVIRLSSEYANLCTRVVAPSQSVAELVRRRGVKRPVQVIPTGVDVDFFVRGDGERFRQEEKISQKAVIIGHVGRLAPEKNLPYLADAVAMYLKNEPRAQFVVIGAGPSENEIRRIVEKYGVENQLTMPGEKTGPQLADAYKAMDLFVFASKTETQGMVLVEAMAAGKPVIALDASGSREVVEDGINGRLLEADTSQETFSSAIKDLLEDRREKQRMEKGAENTAKTFSRLTCMENLCTLYESLLEEAMPDYKDDEDVMVAWNSLLEAIRAEWDLASEKVKAALGAVRDAV